MITMKGKYNTANIMIDEIDSTTREQIQGFLNCPSFAKGYIAIMPDCHAGKGAVIGFTMPLGEYVIPNIIGVDIGCGMLMGKFNTDKLDCEALDDYIHKLIPHGFHINSDISGRVSVDLNRKVRDVCKDIEIDADKALRAVGSLGGGNHFIEAGFSKDNGLCITIHSGSRNFGLQVANHYQKKAKEGLELYHLKGQYSGLEFLPTSTAPAQAYLDAMRTAQLFASENRRTILSHIAEFLGLRLKLFTTIESVHNFIGDDNIIRKGATSARLGENVIIPFNMRDGIALCVGKGSAKYNYSAPHGAGRIMSRSKAKEVLNVEEYKEQMKDVYTTCATKNTIDEAPGAYKDMNIILDNISETVDVIDMIKPVYNFKAL